MNKRDKPWHRTPCEKCDGMAVYRVRSDNTMIGDFHCSRCGWTDRDDLDNDPWVCGHCGKRSTDDNQVVRYRDGDYSCETCIAQDVLEEIATEAELVRNAVTAAEERAGS